MQLPDGHPQLSRRRADLPHRRDPLALVIALIVVGNGLGFLGKHEPHTRVLTAYWGALGFLVLAASVETTTQADPGYDPRHHTADAVTVLLAITYLVAVRRPTAGAQGGRHDGRLCLGHRAVPRQRLRAAGCVRDVTVCSGANPSGGTETCRTVTPMSWFSRQRRRMRRRRRENPHRVADAISVALLVVGALLVAALVVFLVKDPPGVERTSTPDPRNSIVGSVESTGSTAPATTSTVPTSDPTSAAPTTAAPTP